MFLLLLQVSVRKEPNGLANVGYVPPRKVPL